MNGKNVNSKEKIKMYKRFLSLILIITLVCSLLMGCSDTAEETDDTPSVKVDPVTLGLYVESGSISFDISQAGADGGILLPGDKRGEEGELKPVFAELGEKSGVIIEDKYNGGELDLSNTDIIIASISKLDALAKEGALSDISAYSSSIPNLKRVLFDTDLAYALYGEANDSRSGILYVPTLYDAPVYSITPKFNESAIRLLLDGDELPEGLSDGRVKIELTEYMPESGSITVETFDPEHGTVIKFNKNYTLRGNILEALNIMQKADLLTGKLAVKMLRDYIDDMYGDFYGQSRSELFVGDSGMWDVDELRALLLCIKANADILEDVGVSCPMSFSDESAAIAAFGTMCGARCLSAENGFIYTDADGMPRDARIEPETYIALDILGECINGGLVTYSDCLSTGGCAVCFCGQEIPGYAQALPPVAKWYNGTTYSEGVDLGTYFRYTDSVRLYSDYGIAISKAAVSDPNRLAGVLSLLDYIYSEEGRMLVCYGICGKEQKEIELFEYFDRSIPIIDGEIFDMASNLGYSSVAEYMRDYLGAGICGFASDDKAIISAFEGRNTLYSDAAERGLTVTPSFKWTENEWYIASALTLPFTAEEYIELLGYTAFSDNDEAEYKKAFADVIRGGVVALGNRNPVLAVEALKNKLGAYGYMKLLEKAYRRLQEFRDERLWEIEY